MKKCKNITAFGGSCGVQKRVKVYKVYVSWKPCLYSLRRHQKKWFLSNWGANQVLSRSENGQLYIVQNSDPYKAYPNFLFLWRIKKIYIFLLSGEIGINTPVWGASQENLPETNSLKYPLSRGNWDTHAAPFYIEPDGGGGTLNTQTLIIQWHTRHTHVCIRNHTRARNYKHRITHSHSYSVTQHENPRICIDLITQCTINTITHRHTHLVCHKQANQQSLLLIYILGSFLNMAYISFKLLRYNNLSLWGTTFLY